MATIISIGAEVEKPKPHIGWLIDPAEKTITPTAVGDFRNIQEHIHCSLFDVVRITRTESVYVDDMGALVKNEAFAIKGYANPLFGRALVLGSTSSGETVSTKMKLSELKELISWL